MKLSLILENTDIQKALTKLDPKRIQFMCGDRMSSMDSRSSGTEPDIGRTAELVKMLSDCDPTPTKKWVVGTEFIKKPWVSSQFNNGNIYHFLCINHNNNLIMVILLLMDFRRCLAISHR